MSAAYDAEVWHDMFEGALGAAATLAGLIFVAVSLNSAQILQHARLAAIAARSITTLVALAAMSALVLTPGQPKEALGAELLVLGLLITFLTLRSSFRSMDENRRFWWRVTTLLISAVSSLPMLPAISYKVKDWASLGFCDDLLKVSNADKPTAHDVTSVRSAVSAAVDRARSGPRDLTNRLQSDDAKKSRAASIRAFAQVAKDWGSDGS